MAKAKLKPKKFTDASDDADDKRHGVKEGSAKDKALDARRGVPEDDKARKPAARKPAARKFTAPSAGKSMRSTMNGY